MKKWAGPLRTTLAIYRELEAFAQFASDLDATTRAALDRGQRLVELLKQNQYKPLSAAEQVGAVFAGTQGFLDSIAVVNVREFEKDLHAFIHAERSSILADILVAKKKPELNKIAEELTSAINTFKETWKPAA